MERSPLFPRKQYIAYIYVSDFWRFAGPSKVTTPNTLQNKGKSCAYVVYINNNNFNCNNKMQIFMDVR